MKIEYLVVATFHNPFVTPPPLVPVDIAIIFPRCDFHKIATLPLACGVLCQLYACIKPLVPYYWAENSACASDQFLRKTIPWLHCCKFALLTEGESCPPAILRYLLHLSPAAACLLGSKSVCHHDPSRHLQTGGCCHHSSLGQASHHTDSTHCRDHGR